MILPENLNLEQRLHLAERQIIEFTLRRYSHLPVVALCVLAPHPQRSLLRFHTSTQVEVANRRFYASTQVEVATRRVRPAVSVQRAPS